MVLVWNDAKSFQRHLEHMRTFRQSHHTNQGGELAPLKDMPALDDTHSPCNTGGAMGFLMRGKPTLVPIWDIDLARNIQN